MRKRKINPEYLRRITASDVNDERMDAYALASTLKGFSNEYLAGLLTVQVTGEAMGYVNLKLPVVSYLVRLLCEEAEDEPVECTVTLGEKLVIRSTYPMIHNHELTAQVVGIARYAGFKVERDGDILIFSTPIHTSAIMQIYAISSDTFMQWLVTTYNM